MITTERTRVDRNARSSRGRAAEVSRSVQVLPGSWQDSEPERLAGLVSSGRNNVESRGTCAKALVTIVFHTERRSGQSRFGVIRSAEKITAAERPGLAMRPKDGRR